MPILVKRIIEDIDFGKEYSHGVDELPNLSEFPNLLSIVTNPANSYSFIYKMHNGSLINNNRFNQIVNVGPYGVYRLVLRENVSLSDLELEPHETKVDVTLARNIGNNLFYVFYNGTGSESIIIKAKAIKDEGEYCQKLREQIDDSAWREYLVKLAMKKKSSATIKSKKKSSDMMTAAEVADYLGLAEKTIRNWTNSNKIPTIKMGGSARYKKSDIDEYIEKSRKIVPRRKKK